MGLTSQAKKEGLMKQAKILVVDDDEHIREVLRSLLVTQGYAVDLAVDGTAALNRLTDFLPDLILLDVMMPGLSGFDVCRQVKGVESWQHVPIILITALDSKQDLANGLDAGADDFLNKPFDNLELLARVRSMLRIKQQYDMLTQQRQQLEAALRLNERFARVTAQHLEELEVLHDVGIRLMNHLDMDSVLGLISQAAHEIGPEANQCVMHLRSDSDDSLLPIVFSPDSNSKIIYPSVGLEKFVREAIQNRRPVHIPDVYAALESPLSQLEETQAFLTVPLSDDQNPIGTLTILSHDPNTFEQNHRHVLSILANQAVVAIAKARFFEERRRTKEQEKRNVQSLFHRYVSPTVVDRLVEGIDDLVLGGKRQQVTVLFADIRNFTTFSENLPPEHLVEVLNQYLELAVQAILEQEGTLDKFMGDAVMAFFNAPLTQTDHAFRAIQAALAMQKTISQYNSDLHNGHLLSFGIGIHVGAAVVGNIGTVEQMNYTAVGDTINVAKRLQENAKGGQIILSQNAYETVQQFVTVEDLGHLSLKGRAATVQTYSLLSAG